MKLECTYFGKELIDAINRWNPGTKATSTFLNECAASSDFLWDPPEQGMGKWKKYHDIHLLEFGMQCVFKAMSLPRETSKSIVKVIRKETAYHKAESKRDLENRLAGYKLILKNSRHFESVHDLKSMKVAIEGRTGIVLKGKPLGADGPASHAMIFAPEIILKGLVG
jgi:hypothetical protein